MGDKIDMVKVRPRNGGGWMLLRSTESISYLLDLQGGGGNWDIESADPMTREQIDALPEFDGW